MLSSHAVAPSLPPCRAAEDVTVSGQTPGKPFPPASPAAAGPAPGRPLDGYPDVWPLVALVVKTLAGWRCEHCGAHLPAGGAGDAALTVHHLEGPLDNLMDWNLVPLCLRCHALVERLVALDVDQLALDLGDGDLFPWLDRRRRDRQLYPFRPAAAPPARAAALDVVSSAPTSSARFCAWCGRAIRPGTRGVPKRYCGRAHQQAAYRDRQAAQRSLLALLDVADREDG
jgi:hypothetical protein